MKFCAVVVGLLGVALCLAVPFLPVNHDIVTLTWPTAQGTEPVSAPLSGYEPVQLDATVPCTAIRDLDNRSPRPAVLLSTNPPASDYGKLTGLILLIQDGQLSVRSQGTELGSTQLPARSCAVVVHSDGFGAVASVNGQEFVHTDGDVRPQLTGIFSELDDRTDDVRGISFAAEVDNRYDSDATPVKLIAITGGVIAFVGSVFALRRFDLRAGRRLLRLRAKRWWRPTAQDVAVVGALIIWWLIGAMTVDDGYFLTMARVRDEIGYVSDFYRWFAVAVAPMGWFVDVYAWWVNISTAIPWVRLPALAMGIGSWLLISRMVLPRLGQKVRSSQAAGWASGAVFLAFWLPYNNGLRPEPIVVLCTLLTLCAVERAVAASVLMPAALGLVFAALSVAANPHGMAAVLPFVVAFKPLLRLVRKRAGEFGWAPVLAPLAASGLVILTLAFSDQTMQAALDAVDVRKEIGPNGKWYEELSRYTLLFSPTPDGSLTRRFPVLLLILCLATCAVVLLRRSRIRGAALGPSRRLLAMAALSFVALALTPTKHTHHFGIFAAVGGSLAALTALATSSTVLRSKRNRAVFFAGLMVMLAFATTSTNGWWYVSGWGVPWFDKPPSINGYRASTILLIIAAIALIVAFVEHMRIDEHRPEVVTEQRSRALRFGTAPLALVCALLVLAEVVAFGKGMQKQGDSYSLGRDNINQLFGSTGGLSEYVYVETDPRAGMLTVSQEQPTHAAPGTTVPELDEEGESADDYLGVATPGFSRTGLPTVESNPGGIDWSPPYGFGTDRAPVWGSYEQTGSNTGRLRTPWYDIPERAGSGKVPIVLSLAGWELGANSVMIEFGKETDEGFEIMQRYPVAQGPSPEWRDHRVLVGGPSAGATKMRVVANDQAVGGGDDWVAVSAPRVPQLMKMTDVVGDAPTYIEWPAALLHPRLEITSIHDGIADMPRFRVAAGGDLRGVGQGWASPDAGGAFGWMKIATSARELPTYLKNDIRRDWGSLYAIDPYVPDALPAAAAMEVNTETHWGLWSPGPPSNPVRLPGKVPSSDDRTDVGPLGGALHGR